MTDTMASQNIDLSSWDILYSVVDPDKIFFYVCVWVLIMVLRFFEPGSTYK